MEVAGLLVLVAVLVADALDVGVTGVELLTVEGVFADRRHWE